MPQMAEKGFQTSERQRSEPSPGARLRFAGAMGRCSGTERGFFGGGGFNHDAAPSVPRRPGHRRSVGRERLHGHGGAAVGSNDARLRGYDLAGADARRTERLAQSLRPLLRRGLRLCMPEQPPSMWKYRPLAVMDTMSAPQWQTSPVSPVNTMASYAAPSVLTGAPLP